MGLGHISITRRMSRIALAVASLTAVAGLATGYADVFRPRRDYPMRTPISAATIDANQDGSPDLMIARGSYPPHDSLAVLLNDHEGGLTEVMQIRTALNPSQLASTDLNNDGRLDVAATCIGDTVQVLLANADGTFASTMYEVLGDPNFVAMADMSGDGFADLVVTLRHVFRVVVLRNDGRGGFTDWLTLDIVGEPNSVALLNINHDGIPDIAVSVATLTLNLFVSHGYGDYERRTSPMPGFQSHVAAVDIDRDGDEDLVMGHLQGSSVWTLINNGDESFASPISASIGGAPGHLVVADFNRDNWPDVAISVFGMMDILLNTNGTLGRVGSLPSGRVTFPFVEDLDQNGYPDLIGCNGFIDSLFVWLNAEGPTTAVQLESVDYTIRADGVRVAWVLGSGCASGGARVERLDPTEGIWEAQANPQMVRGPRIEFLDDHAVAGLRYAYRLVTERCGPLGEIHIEWDSGTVMLSAEIQPNPAERQFTVVIELPRYGGAGLELLDVQGRRKEFREVGSLGPGRHTIVLGSGSRLAPGIYLVRLVQGDRAVTARACLVE